MCVSPTGKTPSNSVLLSTGSSPMPSRERFIGVLVAGVREERRNPEGSGRTVGSCADGAGAGAGVGAEAAASVGIGAAAGVDGDVYGVG